MNEIVGVFREGQEGKHVIYSFKTIVNEENHVVSKGEPACSACCPEAVFRVSAAPFVEAEKIKWQLNHGQIIYADRITLNEEIATEITPDVVSDMLVEDAILREVDVLRIKIEKQCPVSISLQECDMQIVGIDDNYDYFEIDVPKEAALREQTDNN